MRAHWSRAAWHAAGLVLLVVAAVDLHRTLGDERSPLGEVLNFDTLYPAAVYEDLFVDGFSWDGWRFPAAPFWFPDFAIYFGARAITGAASSAVILYGVLQYALLVAAFLFLLRAARGRAPGPVGIAAALASAAAFVALNSLELFRDAHHRLPFLVQVHTGALICEVFALGLVLLAARHTGWGWRRLLTLLALFVLVAAGVASDRLVIVQLVAPAAAALAATWWLTRCQGGPSFVAVLVLAGTLGAATTAGWALHRWQVPPEGDAIAAYTQFDGARARATARCVAGGAAEALGRAEPSHVAMLAWLAVCGAYAGRALWRGLRRRPEAPAPGDPALLLLAVYFLALVAANFAAVCATGVLDRPEMGWSWGYKYFLPVFLVPLFGWGVWAEAALVARPRCGRLVAGGVLAAAAVAVAAAWQAPRQVTRDVWHWYPPLVQQLDDFAERHNLRYGLAGFWDARVITLLSRTGLRVYQVVRDDSAPGGFAPTNWLGNRDWFLGRPGSRHPDPRFSFVLLGQEVPDRGKVVRAFGEPAASPACEGREVLIYNRPADSAFRDVARNSLNFLCASASGRPGESIRFAGTILPSLVNDGSRDERRASEGRCPEGLLSIGPYLKVRRGVYRVTFATSSDGAGEPNGRWDVVTHDPASGRPAILGAGQLPAGDQSETVTEVHIPRALAGLALECRVFYLGKGSLTVHHIQVDKVR